MTPVRGRLPKNKKNARTRRSGVSLFNFNNGYNPFIFVPTTKATKPTATNQKEYVET
jgi:hypothetical protein